MPYDDNLRLLVDSGQASPRSVAAARHVLAAVEEAYGLAPGDDRGAGLATHLAITLKRLLDGETLIEAPDSVWQELDAFPEELHRATGVAARLQDMLGIPIARDEIGFIALHLCQIRLQAGRRAAAQGDR